MFSDNALCRLLIMPEGLRPKSAESSIKRTEHRTEGCLQLIHSCALSVDNALLSGPVHHEYIKKSYLRSSV